MRRELHEAAVGREVAAQACSAPSALNGSASGKSDLAVGRAAAAASAAASVAALTVGASPSMMTAADELGEHRARSRRPGAGPRPRSGPPGARLAITGVRAPTSASSSSVERHARLPRDGEQVQQAVRGAARGGDPRHRVQQRAAVEEPPRRRAARGERDRELARARRRRRALAPGSSAGMRPSPITARPEAVERDRHRVGGEVARARAHAGAGSALELVELRTRDQPALLGADRLPDVLDRHLAARAGARRASARCRAPRRACRRARAPSARPASSCRSRRGRRARRSRARAPSARSSRRSPRARSATRASRAWPGTGCRRPRSC